MKPQLKPIYGSLLLLAVISCLFIAVILIARYDDLTVTSHYLTRSDAEAAQLFLRGWLPEIIPLSSRSITTINDLDLNVSDGEFHFDGNETPRFTAKLKVVDPSRITERERAHFLQDGYSSFEFENDESRWRFMINSKEGHCVYWMKQK